MAVALGSNLGDRLARLAEVLHRLSRLLETQLVASLYETEPVGYAQQPRYLNAALGIMFLAMVPRASGWMLFWGAVAWAMFVEAVLLITPYTTFFGLPFDGRFIFLTASAHLVFGVVLGLWCCWRLRGAGPDHPVPLTGPV